MSDVHHLGKPAEFTRAMASGLAVQQRERKTALHDLGRLRKQASAEIERLIAFLDACDPYVMTEAEPSLGFPETNVGADSYEIEDGYAGMTDDREADEDAEHSLGFLEWHPSAVGYTHNRVTDHHGSQEHLGDGLRDDLEEEHDGAEGPNEDDEDGADGEPSLGSFDRMTDQGKSWRQAENAQWLLPGVDAEADQCA